MTNQPSSQPVSPAPRPAPRRSPLARLATGCSVLFVLACGLLVVVAGWQRYQQEQHYEAGHAAYLQADCATAIESFDRAIGNDETASDGADAELSARYERRICQAYLEPVAHHADGRGTAALLGYSEFVDAYPDSPLVEAAQDQAAALFAETGPEALASETVCQQVDQLGAQGLIFDLDAHLPPLYLACGQVFEAVPDYPLALYFLDRFRSEFPDHPLAEAVQAAYARTVVADAQASGAGSLPPPEVVGGTGTGPAVLVIRNDSPEKMSLVFSGPVVRVEELAACGACETYIGAGPDGCPEQGPVGEYTLAPGTYDVVVRSIGDGSVVPFRGQWEMNSGEEYATCFFLVREGS